MYLRHLSLADFRNYATAEVALSPGPVVFVGRNGQGKTNLVEAVYYLATQTSHRVASDTPLVRQGTERAIVRGAVVHDGRELLVELEITPGKANRARLNRSPLPRVREALGVLRAVLFAPEDLTIVRGDPSDRRKFLDDLLVARSPRYAGIRSDYERVLKQRNALLKSAGHRKVDLSTLDVWDGHLAQHGSALLAGRIALVNDLAPYVEAAYTTVSDGAGPAQLDYTSSVEGHEPEAILAALQESRAKELDRGITLVGPHRDELALEIGGMPARGYASHGESWSLALALKLAAYELLRDHGGEPVLILDDVFAELDATRREKLAGIAEKATQALVTVAVDADIPGALAGDRFAVHGGEVWHAD